MQCRKQCGACCIAPSITSFIPGMPQGKPANISCVHLTTNFQCKIFDSPDRPNVCTNFLPTTDVCGNSRNEAMINIITLEKLTK